MNARIAVMLCLMALPAFAVAQCTQGTGIMRLLNLDTCRDNIAIVECLGKLQMSTSPMCSIQLQPNLKIASDGTFCEVSKGVLSRGAASGQYSMGRSDIAFQVTNPQSMQAPTMLMMNLKGRVVPDAGGRETQIDCNLLYNVTAGSAMGIVSLGQDSLMSTTITGTAYAAGGYTGSSSSMGLGMQPQQQQQGEALPGTYNGMGMQQQQQQGAMGMGMNGGMMIGMGMGGAAMPGQQVMGAEQGQVPAKTTSGAAAVAAGVRLVAASVLAGLVFAVMLVV
ncbi:hypothetical protein OEZ86_013938 [Tetradesmus obliquus]|nr:hypothetical protein OEZ86_013938 [Tetradesmus obliquus]